MIIVLDTETTGLPTNYHAPLTDFDNWPRAVEIAWLKFDNSGNLIEKKNHIIFPYEFEIPDGAVALHGITTERAQIEGELIAGVLEDLANDLMGADWVVAHNMDYDSAILGSEFLRAGRSNPFDTTAMICTMQASTDFCKIESPRGYKWPRLSELYAILFDGATIEGEHNAEVDALACAKCFFELVKRGVITLDKEADEELDKQASDVLDFLINKKAEESTNPCGPSTPAELHSELIRVYTDQDQTRMTLHHIEHDLWLAERELIEINYQLRKTEGYKACKNDPQRADYLYENNRDQSHIVDIAKSDALGSKLDFERAHDKVELTRALLRVAELAAAVERKV